MSRTLRKRVEYPGDVEDAMPEGNLARWLANYVVETILRVVGVLQRHAVYANLPIYYVEGDPRRHVSPDAFFLVGVPFNPELESYRLWENRVVPCVTFEILSRGSKKKDRVKNRAIYAELGIEEYYWFDPKKATLQALRLEPASGAYVEIQPDSAGRFHSPRLGLDVGVEGKLLGLYRQGQYLLPSEELLTKLGDEIATLRGALVASEQEIAARDQEIAARDRDLAEAKSQREALERRLRELEKGR